MNLVYSITEAQWPKWRDTVRCLLRDGDKSDLAIAQVKQPSALPWASNIEGVSQHHQSFDEAFFHVRTQLQLRALMHVFVASGFTGLVTISQRNFSGIRWSAKEKGTGHDVGEKRPDPYSGFGSLQNAAEDAADYIFPIAFARGVNEGTAPMIAPALHALGRKSFGDVGLVIDGPNQLGVDEVYTSSALGFLDE